MPSYGKTSASRGLVPGTFGFDLVPSRDCENNLGSARERKAAKRTAFHPLLHKDIAKGSYDCQLGPVGGWRGATVYRVSLVAGDRRRATPSPIFTLIERPLSGKLRKYVEEEAKKPPRKRKLVLNMKNEPNKCAKAMKSASAPASSISNRMLKKIARQLEESEMREKKEQEREAMRTERERRRMLRNGELNPGDILEADLGISASESMHDAKACTTHILRENRAMHAMLEKISMGRGSSPGVNKKEDKDFVLCGMPTRRGGPCKMNKETCRFHSGLAAAHGESAEEDDEETDSVGYVPCGFSTARGSRCKLNKSTCRFHAHLTVSGAEAPEAEVSEVEVDYVPCGMPTRRGVPCKMNKATCRFHSGLAAAHGESAEEDDEETDSVGYVPCGFPTARGPLCKLNKSTCRFHAHLTVSEAEASEAEASEVEVDYMPCGMPTTLGNPCKMNKATCRFHARLAVARIEHAHGGRVLLRSKRKSRHSRRNKTGRFSNLSQPPPRDRRRSGRGRRQDS